LSQAPARVYAALIAAVMSISLAAIFFRLAAPTHPLVAAAWRLTLAALISSFWVVRGARSGALGAVELRAAVIAGLIYAVHFGTWVWSLGLTSVASSVTLVCITPLGLALWGWLRGVDAPSRAQVVGMAVASAGVALIGGADFLVPGAGADALLGDALAMAGALVIGGYMVLVRRLGPGLDVMAFSGVACAVGAAVLMSAAAWLGVPLLPQGATQAAALLGCALIPQLIGHTLLTWSLRHVTPTAAGIAVLGEPVGSTVLAALLLHEVVGAWTLVGCAVVLIGVGASLAAGRQT
jgi:drug/metabolite transporter (DMT)-like permease